LWSVFEVDLLGGWGAGEGGGEITGEVGEMVLVGLELIADFWSSALAVVLEVGKGIPGAGRVAGGVEIWLVVSSSFSRFIGSERKGGL
jgi:hypothetical protein